MIPSFGRLPPSVPPSPPPPGAPEPTGCNACSNPALTSTQKLSNSASVCVSCTCKALEGYDPPDSQSVFKVYEDEDEEDEDDLFDDWEFAGDEEKDDEEEDVEASAETSQYIAEAMTVPSALPLLLPHSEASSSSLAESNHQANSGLEVRTEVAGLLDEESGLGQPRACDWLEPPPLPAAVATQERERQVSDEGIMLEAFQQFQHDPQVQKMVVALATDKGVWRAVLANKKLQEYRGGDAEAGDYEVGVTLKEQDHFDSSQPRPRPRMVSRFVLVSHNALRELRDQMRGIMEVVDKRVQLETRQMMFDLLLRTCMMLAFVMLTLIALLCLLPLHASSQGA